VARLDQFPVATSVEIVECGGKLYLCLSNTTLDKLARLEVPAGFPEQLLKHYQQVSAAGSDTR